MKTLEVKQMEALNGGYWGSFACGAATALVLLGPLGIVAAVGLAPGLCLGAVLTNT